MPANDRPPPYGSASFAVASIGPPKCEHCDGPLCVGNAGPHHCPASWQAARLARIADAVTLLESEGYAVTPPAEAPAPRGDLVMCG